MATPQQTGILYVQIAADGNPGAIALTVRKASGEVLDEATLVGKQVYKKRFPRVPLGAQEWYVVTLSWPQEDFHNLSDGAGCTIACGDPPDGTNTVSSWQAAGSGVVAQIPVLMNLPQAG